MTIPEHYSRDIAQRCQTLIRDLRPVVQEGLRGDAQFGGALCTTFLLAIATPMIVLPIERLFKPAEPGASQVGDDRRLDPELAGEVDNVLGPASTFGAAPFVAPGRWSYVPDYQPFNIANRWPDDLLISLETPDAFRRADGALARRLLLDLRNALAHGGIAYLDPHGRQAEGSAAMLAFAGARKRNRQLVCLNTLRVSEDDFYSFLMAWADWLAHPPIRNALNSLDPLAA